MISTFFKGFPDTTSRVNRVTCFTRIAVGKYCKQTQNYKIHFSSLHSYQPFTSLKSFHAWESYDQSNLCKVSLFHLYQTINNNFTLIKLHLNSYRALKIKDWLKRGWQYNERGQTFKSPNLRQNAFFHDFTSQTNILYSLLCYISNNISFSNSIF